MNDNFNNLGFIIKGVRHLTCKQAYQCYLEGAIFVDVREDFEISMKDFGIIGTLFCPFSDFDKLSNALPKDKPLILVDCVGINSKEAVRRLMEKGYTLIANMIGGIACWERDNLPMKNSDTVMSGQCLCISRPIRKTNNINT